MGAGSSALLLLALVAGACELGVTNPNQPDRERALATDSDVESLIASAFNAFWDVSQSNLSGVDDRCSGTAWASLFNNVANHTAASWGNYGIEFTSREPRNPFPNSTADEFSCVATVTWFRSYQGLAAAASGFRAIEAGVEIGPDGANTPRARAFGKLSQGLLHGYLALIFDKGFIFDETVALTDEQGSAIIPEFVGYQEMQAAAVGYLEEAIAIANANSFMTRSPWLNGTQLSNAELAALAHSYIGRFEMRTPRTPAEADARDWSSILNHLQQGHSFDLAIQGDFESWWSGLKRWGKHGGNSGFVAVVNMWTVGPADQSGGFQNWVSQPVLQRFPFDVITPDARIPEPNPASADGCMDGLDTPQCGGPPLFIGYHPNPIMPEARGVYRQSFYSGYEERVSDLCNFVGPGITWSGRVCEFTQRDLAFLTAEALWRTGNVGAALDIINGFRTQFGGLPPATADGVVGQAQCVPRNPNGDCGGFLDVLRYEKGVMVQAEHTGDMYGDKRRWGTLVPGSWIHLPVPADELETLELTVYTCPGAGCGGPGGGAVPAIVPGDRNSILTRAKWDLEAIQAMERRRQSGGILEERR